MTLPPFLRRIKLDRHELAGSFGDIGTDFPLIVGMILASGLDPAGVLITFGALQILTGLIYGIPMPVQPLKAVAVIVISQKISGNIIYGGGLAIGILMFLLTSFRVLDWMVRVIPKTVIRGIQFGLGIQLSLVALKEYVPAQGLGGYALALICLLVVLILMGNRKYPPALIVIALGVAYALIFRVSLSDLTAGAGLRLPGLHFPTISDVATGFVVLALPQIALSVGNSVLATRQVVKDFFPAESIGVRKIGFTYSLMNVIAPFLSGIPVCHGSGGMAGHYFFGARTGGSVIIYGTLYLIMGVLFSGAFQQVIEFFPKPVLGVLLVFEGVALISLSRDVQKTSRDFMLVILTALMAVGLPYGYLVALLVGTGLYYLLRCHTPKPL